MKITIILFMLFILLITPIYAQKEGSITLLSLYEEKNETENILKGDIAELHLTITPGRGAIYIDSYPLTKINTQISTRTANQIACDLARIDCSKYDFLYVIRSKTTSIGGPSAGAGMTVLTYALLKDLSLRDDITMTGTINSGGFIGPVGGIREKTEAAAKYNFSKVIIPAINLESNITNITFPHTEVIQLSRIEEAIELFTNTVLVGEPIVINPDPLFIATMKEISVDLCHRTLSLNKQVIEQDNLTEEAREIYREASNAISEGKYYAGASLCFTANIKFRQKLVEQSTQEEKQNQYLELIKNVEFYDIEISSKPIETITDLEAYVIVEERLLEARDIIENIDEENISAELLAYAIERYHSAISWSNFFGKGVKKFILDEQSLRNSCMKKISEVEEQVEYVSTYVPTAREEIREKLKKAYEYLEDEQHALCLFKASSIKAETNMIVSLLYVPENDLQHVVLQKIESANRLILYEQQKMIFPVLGYSYAEYAHHLLENKTLSALIYAEYAIEFSNLDAYFRQKASLPFIGLDYLLPFCIGVLAGVVSTLFGVMVKPKKRRR